MRIYLAKIDIAKIIKEDTGLIGEKVFEKWFKLNFNGEKIFKQLADRDYEHIDFADEKGYTYQVKATKGCSYTFNCQLEDVRDCLKADLYVFIQIKDNIAYIENLYDAEYVLSNMKASYKYNNCFIYSKDLLQYKLGL